MPDVGDRTPATLLVSPFDDTTDVLLQVTAPDGDVSSPTASSEDGGNTWTADIEFTLAGLYTLKWVVSGTGASTSYEEIGVRPAPDYVDPYLRVYATTTDLANFLRDVPPEHARKSLENASQLLEGALLTAIYPTDIDGYPTNPVHAAAFARAVCAIVEWWVETGDELGAGADWASASAGGVSVTKGGKSTTTTSRELPAKAWLALNQVGVLPGMVYQR